MTALVGPLHIVCCVLAMAGAAKLLAPRPTRAALHAVGATVPLVAVRALGVAEIALGGWTIAAGGTVGPVLVGIVHLGFAAFVLESLRRGTATSCGCFGASDAPPSPLHVVVVSASAAVAFAAVGADDLATVLAETPAAGVAHALWVGIGSAAVVALLTVLPTVGHRGATVAEFGVRSLR